jgi:hypothetical protein
MAQNPSFVFFCCRLQTTVSVQGALLFFQSGVLLLSIYLWVFFFRFIVLRFLDYLFVSILIGLLLLLFLCL